MADIEREAEKVYRNLILEPNTFPALAACETLLHFLSNDQSGTFLEYSKKMTRAVEALKQIACLCEVDSVTEIFTRFTTLRASEFNTMKEAKEASLERAELFLTKIRSCTDKIAKNSHPFISDGHVVLVHSSSSAVIATLMEAKRLNKRFTVYVTECIDQSGKNLAEFLSRHKIKTVLISDSAIGFYMEKIDVVLVGAEGVVENGGIINLIGTYPLALCAKATNISFYVIAESYKFLRLFPISQEDIPERLRNKASLCDGDSSKDQLSCLQSRVDYTPPSYITLLLTDLGPLTTAAVSDVLINLYL